MTNWKRHRIDRRTLWVAACCLCMATTTAAADTPAEKIRPLTDDVELRMTFAIDSLCRIIDPRHTLDAFWKDLLALRTCQGKDAVLPIVHLGDSHIQGGYYSNETMNLLRRTFGNAGRGWIAPYRPARENGPSDYRIFSGVKSWSVGRCTRPQAPTPWGIGGMGLQTDAEEIDFTITLNGSDDAFNRALLYRGEYARPMVTEEVRGARAAWGTDTLAPNLVVDTFSLPTPTRELHLRSVSRSEAPSTASPYDLYYGFVLTNGRPGILYHAIGRNGATYVSYTNDDFVRQLALLKPRILIITLGTNESFGNRFSPSDFIARVDRFVRLVRKYMPSTTIILSTPAENYLPTRTVVTRRVKGKRGRKRRVVRTVTRGYVRNEHVGEASQAILNYARREGLACFDLYGMTGGAGSCEKWQGEGLFSHDRVHYSVAGYREQGRLLYKALVRSALDYQKRNRK